MIGFFKKIDASLDNHSKGWSARKLSALFAILMAAYITKFELPQEAQLHALYAWLLLVVMCLGIVTAEQIIKFKNGKDEKPTDTINNTPTE
jgi:hypothetical protein